MNRSFVPLAFGFCVLLASVGSEHGLPGLIKARAQSRRLAAEVAALKAENDALRVRVDQLQNDPSTIEVVARRELGLVRPDELVITVQRAEAPTQP